MVSKKALLGQIADVDIRLLRVFKVVAEAGGFSAAELELNIGRSTISRHIKDLETRLGVSLCRRGRGGFALSEEGRVVYAATGRLLSALDAFRAEVDEVHERITGTLALALFDKTATNRESHIHEAINRFDALAPNVDLEVHVESMTEIEKGVMEGTFGVGIIPEHRESSSLSYLPLFAEDMYLYCAAGHPLHSRKDEQLSMDAVLQSKYVGLGYHSPNMEQGREQQHSRAATAYDQEAIATLVLSGVYIGYLPDHYARSFVDSGLLRAVAVDQFHYRCQYAAIVRRSPRPSRLIQTFLQCLEQAHTSTNLRSITTRPTH